MISDQFVASKSLDEAGWLSAREGKITATLISKAHTPAGRAEALAKLRGDSEPIQDNAYMAFGREMEPFVSMFLLDKFSILPNDWLVKSRVDDKYVATPDGISFWAPLISEVKTTGKDWGSWSKVPAQYKRQVQWQLYVTQAEECVFSWLLREERDGVFVSPWMEPKCTSVKPDEEMISELVALAEGLIEEAGL
jgi:hypothetical protein